MSLDYKSLQERQPAPKNRQESPSSYPNDFPSGSCIPAWSKVSVGIDSTVQWFKIDDVDNLINELWRNVLFM